MLACESWKEFWNEPQLVPYAKGKENYPWAGYDNVKSMQLKAKYIIDENLAGAMFWTIDLDDFTGKFCCQGHYPLIRTVKSILEDDPAIMPPTNICDKCPNTEYKTLKKKTKKKRSVDEVCTEKGEGVWIDPEDCTKYFTCRSMSTTWAEKKHETCYTGSYFEIKSSSCKWVGIGNFDCATANGDSDTGDSKPAPKKKDESPAAAETGESGATVATGTDTVRNRQKIFYEGGDKQSSPFGDLADSIMPRNLYTCKADQRVELDSYTDYVKCYSCDSDAKNLDKCKVVTNDASAIIWCYQRTQSCYTKQLQNTTNNEIISFSRGCASLSDLDAALSTSGVAHTTVPSRVNGPRSNVTTSVQNCMNRNNKTKTCYVICDTNLCNNVTEIKSNANINLILNFNYMFFNFILLIFFALVFV
jgi:hypothetical protein